MQILFFLSLFLLFPFAVQADMCTVNVSQSITGLQSSVAQFTSLESNPINFLAFTSRRSQQQQSLQVPGNTWITMASSPPGTIGSITRLWAANNNVGTGNTDAAAQIPGCGQVVLNAAFRITFNQASVPQFGGVNGINWEMLFGRGQTSIFGTTDSVFTSLNLQSNKIGSLHIGSPWKGFSGFFNHAMPFTNGFTVEYNSGVSSVTPVWMNVEWSLASSPPVSGLNWVLKAAQMPNTPLMTCGPATTVYPVVTDTYQGRNYSSISIPNLAEQPLLNWTASASEKRFAFLGSVHTIRTDPATPTGTVDLRSVWEGDYRQYADSANATYHISGTEDYYMSSYYFAPAPIAFYNYWGYAATLHAGIIAPSAVGTSFLGAYRFFEPNELGYASTNFTFTWTNGDPPGFGAGINLGYPVHSVWSVFYYTSDS
jgi:hypothetical protein